MTATTITPVRSKSGRDQRDAIASLLIDAAVTGTAPWQRGWNATDIAALAPRNAITGNRYSGANALYLWLLQLGPLDTTDARWMTYRQAESQGWQVRKGAKSVQLIKVGVGKKKDEFDANGDPKTYTFLSTFNVFHASDVDGIPELEDAPQHYIPSEVTVPEQIAAIITHGDANVLWRELPQGQSPSYLPSHDMILLPKPDQFDSEESLSATALHELAHWTSHADREARQISTTFGSAVYAAEELVADTAAFLTAAELGLAVAPQNTAAYLRSWSKGDRETLDAAIPAAVAVSRALVGLASGEVPAKWQRAAKAKALAA